jgi:hypothetical protein
VEGLGSGCGGDSTSFVPVEQRYNLKMWQKWHIAVKWLEQHLVAPMYQTHNWHSKFYEEPIKYNKEPILHIFLLKELYEFLLLVKRVIKWNLVRPSH